MLLSSLNASSSLGDVEVSEMAFDLLLRSLNIPVFPPATKQNGDLALDIYDDVYSEFSDVP